LVHGGTTGYLTVDLPMSVLNTNMQAGVWIFKDGHVTNRFDHGYQWLIAEDEEPVSLPSG